MSFMKSKIFSQNILQLLAAGNMIFIAKVEKMAVRHFHDKSRKSKKEHVR
ncbi:hypothetical protein [Niveispirillum sp. BGYR6]|nr:hypothetical protein [Niveispirillum sp. BGYR6]MDG5497655.1 hypothetical protein [Niveispirillum sp. BGYR6]